MAKPAITRPPPPGPAVARQVGALIEAAARLRDAGDLAGAERHYQGALRLEPGSAAALNGMGNLATAAGRHDLALDYHRRAVKAAPKDPGLLNDLANALIQAGEPENALPLLRKALAVAPRLKPALLNLARANRDLGEPDRALAALGKLGARPEAGPDLDATLERAVILAESGRGAEAVPLFRAVLAGRPAEARALEGLATSHRATPGDHDLSLMETALAQASLTPRQCAAAHWARGKILDDLGRPDEAFAAFRQANEVGGPAAFSMAAHLALVEGTIGLFQRAHFAARPGFGLSDERPVFVVGMPRSGTTLIEQILASHGHIAGLGERPEIEAGLARAVPAPPGSAAFFDGLQHVRADTARAEAARYLAATARRRGAALRAVDKMPHNFLALGWIALLFPAARVIHCVRDPLDVCVSCYTHHFADAHAYSNDLAELGTYYRSYQRLMRHWSANLPLAVLEVRYEDVVGDLEGAARRMVAHLGLDWDARCLDFHKGGRVVQTPSRWQVRQPIYGSSIGRWRRYEAHLGPLIQSLGRASIGS